MKPQAELWYDRPARKWTEALPLGNGFLGAMVFGGPCGETIQLNEGSFWSGAPDHWYNTETLANLPEVRRLLDCGEYARAQALIEDRMVGKTTAAYLPLGDLTIAYGGGEVPVSGYRRSLSLEDAAFEAGWRKNGAAFRVRAFASNPDRVLVYAIRSDRPFSLTVSLSGAVRHTLFARDGMLLYRGTAPSEVLPYKEKTNEPFVYGKTPETSGMRFCAAACVQTDGSSEVGPEGIRITNAGSALLLLTADTSFSGYNRHPFLEGIDETALAVSQLKRAAAKTEEELFRAHLADYRGLFGRVSLFLGDTRADWPTDRRVVEYSEDDTALSQLAFDFGRYLMISGSRPGGRAMNLQGIWNKDAQATWRCNYTTNINTQMNYWPAPVCGLPECQEPFDRLMENASANGRRIAELTYGCRGWMFHHNLDLWALATPGGGASSSVPGRGWQGSCACLFWPMGGVWLCSNLWQEYDFTRDTAFLRGTAYPLMKGAAEFCLDWMVRRGDTWTTSPSTSPENHFLAPDGSECAADIGTTCDISLIFDLFTHCIAAAKILGCDAEFASRLADVVSHLPPLQKGSEGQLLEWSREFGENTLGHRHVSHLFALYPGDRITHERNAEFLGACAVSLRRRLENGGGGTGWSLAWLVSLFARLGDAAWAQEILRRYFSGSVYANLFDLHPSLAGAKTDIFQIDGNFGVTAGIAEMLLQSHESEIVLLPCLPEKWSSGSVRGLRARGGFRLDFDWENGRVTRAAVSGAPGSACTVRFGGSCRNLLFSENETRKELRFP